MRGELLSGSDTVGCLGAGVWVVGILVEWFFFAVVAVTSPVTFLPAAVLAILLYRGGGK